MSTKAEQLEWRRSKVVEMRARGLSYAEIAKGRWCSTNIATVDSALNYIKSKQEQQQQKKYPSLDSSGNNNNNEDDDDQLTETGGGQTIF